MYTHTHIYIYIYTHTYIYDGQRQYTIHRPFRLLKRATAEEKRRRKRKKTVQYTDRHLAE